MIVTTETSTPTEIILNIAMDAADEEPFIDRSYRRTVGNLAIPGFRKGKAPRSVVENHVGRQALLREAIDYMIPETLNRVMQEQQLQAFIEPQVEMLEWEPVAFKAVIPLEPPVDLGDFRQLRLEKETITVPPDQVERAIEQLRNEAAPWEPAARPTREGDLINLNVLGFMDGQEIVNDQAVDYLLRPENVLPFPGFSQHLAGLNEGEGKEFTIIVPPDYPRPEFAGREVAFQVEVLSVKEKNLPEPDDEFAKGVGEGFDNMEDLRADIVERLNADAEARANYAFQELSLATLLDTATIGLSDLVIAREVQGIVEEREQMLRNQRLDMESYLGYIGKTPEEFQAELRPDAIDRLNRTLAMRQLAKEEGIAVSPEEVQAEIDDMVENTAAENRAAMRRVLNSADNVATFHNSILTRKTINRLVAIFLGEADADTDSETIGEADPETEADTDTDTVAADTAADLDAESAAVAETDTADTADTANAAPETPGNNEGANPNAD